MSYEEKDNEGVLFRNDKRETDKHPHAKGSAKIDGVEYWVSGWTNVSAKGDKYQKLSFQRKDQQQSAPQAPARPQASGAALDDDIPFRCERAWP